MYYALSLISLPCMSVLSYRDIEKHIAEKVTAVTLSSWMRLICFRDNGAGQG